MIREKYIHSHAFTHFSFCIKKEIEKENTVECYCLGTVKGNEHLLRKLEFETANGNFKCPR